MTSIQIIELIITGGIGAGIIRMIFSLGKLTQKINTLSTDSKEVKNEINQINMRLSRLEGSFYERGYWESRKIGNEYHKRK